MIIEERKIERKYIAIDLKSFYASVECVERKLDPLRTNLVVADASRTGKTICLAVTPSLKAYGISGRARLFEAAQRVREVNQLRLHNAVRKNLAVKVNKPEDYRQFQPEIMEEPQPDFKKNLPKYCFRAGSFDDEELRRDESLELSYIIAPPRMSKYMEYSARIFSIYLKYIAPEDIHVYSIDECFMDVTPYLNTYGMSARELTMMLIREVLYETGITATGGIGSNLYLCKVAMDIVAKHVAPDKDGVRVAELDEMSYRKLLWSHRPLTDFWRVGSGISRRLEKCGLYTMGDIARFSETGEDYLYKMFGINAELLIDHAWGREPCTMKMIKQYRPASNSLSTGQVLSRPYGHEQGQLIVREMADLLALQLVEKNVLTNQLILAVGYDTENLTDDNAKDFHGEIVRDWYGRYVPKPVHGSVHFDQFTSSSEKFVQKAAELYEKITNPNLTIRRVTISSGILLPSFRTEESIENEQMSLFTIPAEDEIQKRKKQHEESEAAIQRTLLEIKKRYGKNAILKGMNYLEGATTIERNGQVGGHKA